MLGTFATIPRSAAVMFTIPYIYLGTGVIALKSSNIRTLEDIKKSGVRVSLTQGTAQHRWAVDNLPDAKLVVSTALTEVRLMDVIAGKADVAFGDSGQTYRFVRAHPECINLFEDKPLNMMPICWAVRKGDFELLNFMNNAINVLHSTGKLNQFIIKHGIEVGTVYLPKLAIVPFSGKE